MREIGPFLIVWKCEFPAWEKANKLARTLSENDIEAILDGKKHLHANPVRVKGVPHPIIQDWNGNNALRP
jgi:hypothetical protein